MSLDTYAITTVDKAKNRLRLSDSDLYADGLTIYHDASAAATAVTVEVTATTMVLTITGGANAGTDTLTFSAAANDTLGELVAVINALAKGFVANLSGVSAADSTDLVITSAVSCLGTAATRTLEIVDNYLLERLIDAATYEMEAYCDRKFASRSYSGERYSGDGGRVLNLRNYPCEDIQRLCVATIDLLRLRNTSTDASTAYVTIDGTNLTLVVVGGANASSTALALTTYTTIGTLAAQVTATGLGWSSVYSAGNVSILSSELLHVSGQYCLNQYALLRGRDAGEVSFFLTDDGSQVVLQCNFPEGIHNVIIDYTAGYTTVPHDLEMICNDLVAEMYDATRHDTGLQSERLGDYSYTIAANAALAASPAISKALRLYKRFFV